jgi:hypothetical protein
VLTDPGGNRAIVQTCKTAEMLSLEGRRRNKFLARERNTEILYLVVAQSCSKTRCVTFLRFSKVVIQLPRLLWGVPMALVHGIQTFPLAIGIDNSGGDMDLVHPNTLVVLPAKTLAAPEQETAISFRCRLHPRRRPCSRCTAKFGRPPGPTRWRPWR